jgi:tetratricopeptide (TPR) repeat protein
LIFLVTYLQQELVLALRAAVLSFVGISIAFAQTEPPTLTSDHTRALERELQTLLANQAPASSDPRILVHLADLYLDLGDDVYSDETKRRAAYEEGARLAHRAIELDESNAQAHYLYAANLGNAAQLKGVMASAFTIRELKRHVRRTLELNPNHAPALHMMGMMLEELPWVLGGDADAALTYLNRAVTADPQYTHARLDLGKAYLKRQQVDAARRELNTIVNQAPPRDQSASEQRHRREARHLLASLTPRQHTPGSHK